MQTKTGAARRPFFVHRRITRIAWFRHRRCRELAECRACIHGQSADRTPDAQRLRELAICQGAHGYIALYRHVIALDTVFVLAIRAQREAGHAREE
jgi:hypothetical protein